MNWTGKDRGQRPGGKHRSRSKTLPQLLRPRLERLEDRRLLSTEPFPVPPAAVDPPGGLIYDSSVDREIAAAGERDRFTIDLDDPQTITAVVYPQATLQPLLGLTDPAGAPLDAVSAAAPGESAVVQTVPVPVAGTYTIWVGGAAESTGPYSLRLVLNAAVEGESHHGPANDDPAAAEDLDAAFISLGAGTAQRAGVLGNRPTPVVDEDFESGALGADWTAFSSEPGGRIRVTAEHGTAGGSYALLMDHDPGGYPNLNEAVWTVDLSGLQNPRLSFFHAQWDDSVQGAEGVDVSDDGVSWHRVWDPPEQADGVWRPYTIDLGAEAAAAGISLGADFRIKFQQYDRWEIPFGGRGYDEIAITTPAPPGDDWYRFTLDDGQTAALALAGPSHGGAILELYDDGRNLLAAGTAAENVQAAINHFVDPTTDAARDTYFVRVAGAAGNGYSLVVGRNAGWDVEPNNGPGTRDRIPSGGAELGHVGHTPSATLTEYQKLVAAGIGGAVSIDGERVLIGAPGYDGDEEDSGAAYVFGAAGRQWFQQQRLTADDADSGDYFGRSVSISGDTAIAAAMYDDHDGDRWESGSTYVFGFDGSRWTQRQKLTASDAERRDYFGYSASLSGNTVFVGAPRANDRGAAYVFQFDGSQWVEQQKLTGSDTMNDESFGNSVCVSGNTAIVADYAHGDHHGSAYVFEFDGSRWIERQMLMASDMREDALFGSSVAIDGDTAVIGARSAGAGTSQTGAAYVFQFDGVRWTERQKLFASDADRRDYFGSSVAVSGHTLVVGAPQDNHEGGLRAGSAYVFRFDGSRWIESNKLVASDAERWRYLGGSVSLSDNIAVVGGSQGAYCYNLAPEDDYLVEAVAGDRLAISTSTPSDGPGEFTNLLDPVVELYDPDGALAAADDNGAPDGRNAVLTHTATVTGGYTVRVLAAGSGRGEYVLNVDGHTGAPPAFEVAATDPDQAAWLRVAPPGLTVHLNDSLLLTTLDASDLTIDAVPARAAAVVDGDTVVFQPPAGLGDGVHQVAIAAGALLDLQGTPLRPFAGWFEMDTTPPRVIESSLLEGDVLPTGGLVYTARFDKELDASRLDPDDVRLRSQGKSYAPDRFNYEYDPLSHDSTLTLEYAYLSDSAYTLTLRSGDGHFEDLIGHDLDGEADPVTTVPSGNGTGGGDFVVGFSVDAAPGPFLPRFGAQSPLGSLIYRAATSAAVGAAADNDSFTIDLDESQTITLLAKPRETLQPTVEAFDPAGTSLGRSTAGAPGEEVVLQTVPAAASGTYTITIGGANGTTGRFSLEVILNAALEMEEHGGPANDGPDSAQDLDGAFVALPGDAGQRSAVLGHLPWSQRDENDWYCFTLDDGQTATLLLTDSDTRRMTLELYDGSRRLLATGSGAENADQVINDFLDGTTDAVAETYYAHVAGNPGPRYRLLVTRNAAFDTEPNAGLGREAQDITLQGSVLGYIDSSVDGYAIGVRAGDELIVATATPGGGPGEFVNELDPAVSLYDPHGDLVASDDNGAIDGRNALLSHSAAATGLYTIRVLPADGSSGEYVLSVGGHTAAPSPFETKATDPRDGGVLAAVDRQLLVYFNGNILLSSLQVADLTVDGVPAQAVAAIDGSTAAFRVPSELPDGPHTAAIAAGAVLDVRGTPLEPLSTSFQLDTTPPRVIESSLLSGDVVPAGRLVYTARFDRGLNAANLHRWRVSVRDQTGWRYNDDAMDYDPDDFRLTIEWANLPESQYRLTLPSGDGQLEDLLGHALDGEPDPAATVPSGDGWAGGDFYVDFFTDGTDADVDLYRLDPLGSLIPFGARTRRTDFAGDEDEFTLFAQAGETLSAMAWPDEPTALLSIELPGMAGPFDSPGPGQPAVLPVVHVEFDGTYTVRVSGDTVGTYRFQVGKNLAVETVDTHQANAMPIDDSYLGLGSGRYAVLGHCDVRTVELLENGGFETGDFTGWTAASNGLEELVPWTVAGAGGGFFFNSEPLEGAYSAYNGFDGQAGLTYELYQDVTISPLAYLAQLSVNYRLVHSGGGGRSLTIEVCDTDNRVLNTLHHRTLPSGGQPQTDLGWEHLVFDLSAHAGQTVRIRFSQQISATFAGPALIEFDDLRLTVAERRPDLPEVDAYTVDLTGKAGRSVDVVLAGLTAADFSAELLELLDTDGATVLATAVAEPLGLTPEDFDLALLDFTVPADGIYTLRLTTSVGGDYSMVVTDSLVLDTEPNDGIATLRQPLRSLDETPAALGYARSYDRDYYWLTLHAGQTTVILTDTPLDDPQIARPNTLDPRLLVLDAHGVQLAADTDSAPDGKNALLSFVPPQTGRYYIVVAGESYGEYTLKVDPTAQVVGRHVFYNNSAFDGNHPAPGAQDDAAIASDKRALLPGETAAFANYTGYSRGINGIMVDIAGLVHVPTLADFRFRTGNSGDPGTWTGVLQTPIMAVRPGDGVGGSHRVTFVWEDNTLQNQWLQVTVLAAGNVGLEQDDVFYFGNAIGESGNSTTDAKVTAHDMLAVRDNQRSALDPAPIDFAFDFDRNARVNAADMLIARNNTTHLLNALRLITVPAGKVGPHDAKAVGQESAHDTVLRRVCGSPQRQSPQPQTPPHARLDWLYQFEPVTARNRQPATSDAGDPSTANGLR